MLSVPRSERRPYMRAAYALFKGDSTEKDLAKQMEVASSANRNGEDASRTTSGAPYFYANLYLGLYAEAKGDEVLARKCEQVLSELQKSTRLLVGLCPSYPFHCRAPHGKCQEHASKLQTKAGWGDILSRPKYT